MANMFGRLGYGGIKANPKVGPGEQAFDQVEDNITTHYNEEIKVDLRAQVTGRSSENPNGGLCNDVNQGG